MTMVPAGSVEPYLPSVDVDVRGVDMSPWAQAVRMEARRLIRERRTRVDKARLRRLDREVAAWRFARDVREYVAAVRVRVGDLDGLDRVERDRIMEWLAWAEDRVRLLDPSVDPTLIRGLYVEPHESRLSPPYPPDL